VSSLGGGVDVDAGTRLGGQGLVSREVIGVDVGVDDVGQLEALTPGPGHVVVHTVPARVRDQRLARLATADQVGDAARVPLDPLLADHGLPLPSPPTSFTHTTCP